MRVRQEIGAEFGRNILPPPHINIDVNKVLHVQFMD